jgi:hypothetical protein
MKTVDVWFSLKLLGRYSYHWERRAIDGSIYRHDNTPHKRWQTIGTFPCPQLTGNCSLPIAHYSLFSASCPPVSSPTVRVFMDTV